MRTPEASSEVVFSEPPTHVPLAQAAVRSVAYADVFDYPLRAAEVHRYLHGVSATLEGTAEALAGCCAAGNALSYRDGYYTLPGREALVDVRRRRAVHASELWSAALKYGRLIAALPFVRMVAVTGSLAWSNVDDSADIDYLIVTEPGRLWLCRLFIRVIARVAARSGVKLCTNYLISERVLTLTDQTLYTAYELVRMTPLAGLGMYRRMRAMNTWAEAYLPNAIEPSPLPAHEPRPTRDWLSQMLGPVARLAEWALRTSLGGMLERFEMNHRIGLMRRRELQEEPWVEAVYDADRFKAHIRGYQRRIMTAFAERSSRLAARTP